MPVRPPALDTERLRLVTLLADELDALVAGDSDRAGTLAGIRFPPGWPTEQEARKGLPWHLGHLRANPAHLPWRVRVIVERASGEVIGSTNLKGPPDENGDVELGWGLVERARGCGYAFEAATAVIAWAAAQPGVRTLSATIPDENIRSQHLAARLGMTRTGSTRRGLPLWERPAACLI